LLTRVLTQKERPPDAPTAEGILFPAVVFALVEQAMGGRHLGSVHHRTETPAFLGERSLLDAWAARWLALVHGECLLLVPSDAASKPGAVRQSAVETADVPILFRRPSIACVFFP